MNETPRRRAVKTLRADWTDIVLVCRKCSKKLKGGFGADGDERFAKALRTALAARSAGGTGDAPTPTKGGNGAGEEDAAPRKAGRKTRKAKPAKGRRARLGILEVGCFDICPKDAVVALSGAAPGEWRVIPRGTPMVEAARVLGLAPAAGDAEG